MFFASLTPARRNRLALVGSLILLVGVLLWAARNALVPYVLGLALAYVMLPVVNRLEAVLRRVLRRPRPARAGAILLTYLLAAGLIALFFALIVPVVGQQFNVLWNSRGELRAGAQRQADRFLGWYDVTVPPDIQAQVNELLGQVTGTLVRALQAGIVRTLGVVTNAVTFVLGLIVIPFWLFYVLYDQSMVMRGMLGMIPVRVRPDLLNLVRIADGILSKYLRGQLILCVFIGVLSTVGLTVLGVRFPAVLGLMAGVFEILPFIGPILGLIPAAIVATIQDPVLGLWTVLLFTAIQQIENVLLVPRISGKAVELHPALIMVVLVVGYQVAGLWGMILAVPLAAIVRDVFKYLYLRFQDEPLSPREAMVRLGRTPMQLDV